MAWTRTLASGKYQGLYRDKDGRVRTVAGGPYTHKRAAARAASAAEEKSRAAGWRSPDAGRRTWSDWCSEWWSTREVEASTLRSDAGRRDNHLLPRWHNVELADITRHDIKAWAASLEREDGKPLAPATKQRVVHLLSASLAAAVDAEILTANPAARINLGGGNAGSERFLTRDEFAAVLDQLTDEHAAMAMLLVATGMRWGEAAGLHWQRVDQERGFLEVAETWSLTSRTMKPYPKGKKRRQVPLPAWLELGDTVGGSCGYTHDRGACRSGLVVTTPAGTIVDQSAFGKVWRQACVDARIGHARPHDLRHTYASWLLQDQVSLAEVGKLLGHVSPLTTQVYAHLAEIPSSRVLNALGDDPRRASAAARAADVQQTQTQPRLTILKGGIA